MLLTLSHVYYRTPVRWFLWHVLNRVGLIRLLGWLGIHLSSLSRQVVNKPFKVVSGGEGEMTCSHDGVHFIAVGDTIRSNRLRPPVKAPMVAYAVSANRTAYTHREAA